MLGKTSVKGSEEEHIRDGEKCLQSGMKVNVSNSIGYTAQAECKEKATLEIRKKILSGRFYSTKAVEDTSAKRSASTCRNKLHWGKHEKHTVIDKDNEGGKDSEGKVDRRPTQAKDYFGGKRKRAFRSDPSSNKNIKKMKKHNSTATNFDAQEVEAEKSGSIYPTESILTQKSASESSGPQVMWNEEDGSSHNEEYYQDCPIDHATHESNVLAADNFDSKLALPGPSSSRGIFVYSNAIVTPNMVEETLRLFRIVCRTLQEEKLKKNGISCRRVDCQAARILKDSLRHINLQKPIFGDIPGVEVNDQFLYRMELAMVGLHRPPQSGIDYLNQGGRCLATSIVASGGYKNDVRDPDTLIYVGQGGRVTSKKKDAEDQVLERGNLALMNSIKAKNPVRVLRKTKVINSFTGKNVETYTYDGLYRVTKYWYELGPHEKLVYKFWLIRIPGQPKLVHK